jgi:hypothetical protein
VIRCLPVLAALSALLLAGCAIGPEENPTRPAEEIVDLVPLDEVWAGAEIRFGAALEIVQGNPIFGWECEAGELLGFGGAQNIWRTPASGPAWLQVTVLDGPDVHVCRRVYELPRGPVELHAPQLDSQEVFPGQEVELGVDDRSPGVGTAWIWGCSSGDLSMSGTGVARWIGRAAGGHRIWIRDAAPESTLADTLELLVRQVPPLFDVVYVDDIAICGQPFLLMVNAVDENHEALTLAVVDGGGLELIGLEALGPSQLFQGTWSLILRAPAQGPGFFPLRLRLSDGILESEQVFPLDGGCD